MQKTKVMCLIVAMVLASVGTVSIAMNMSGDTTPPVIPDNAVDTVLDRPEEGSPSDRSAIENLYIAQGELQRKGGFVGTTEGTAISAGLAQNVLNNRVVIGDRVFKEMITIGVVKNAYQLYLDGGNYLYRKPDSIKSATSIKWADTAERYSEEGFLEKFGHFSNKLTGYILNDETIVSGELEKEENGLFTYRYVLDKELAVTRMLYEMKTNSNMSGYSVFTKAEIVVTMDANWQVKTLSTDCEYKVPMFGGINCVESCTETFSDLTVDELPEKDFFEQFFDAEIVDKPVISEPDALSILMDMFAPYIGGGNSLNASIAATMDGKTILNGLVSAKIDIENIENIEVAAKIGQDLFVEYQQGNVYVTYQDFKASTTVDGIMGVINAFMPKENATIVSDGNSDDILSKINYSIADGVCTVNLPLELGEEKLDVNIYANVTDNGYEFTYAQATLGSLVLKIELAESFNVPEHSGEYPEILGLLDIVKNGVIYGNINAFDMNLDVMFDLSSMSLYAANDDLSVIYKNNVIFAQLGAIKAKLNIEDIDSILTLLRLAGIIDGSVNLELPQISLDQVLAALSNITATSTDDGVAFNLSIDDLSIAVYLAAMSNGWNVEKLTVDFDGNVITLAMTAPTIDSVPEIDDKEYADAAEMLSTFIRPVVSLVSAKSYGANFRLGITIDNILYNVEGSFSYDSNKNINIQATVTNDIATVIKANVTVANNVVYLDVNGLKTAFAADALNGGNVDLSQIVDGIYGVNTNVDGLIDAILGVINKIKNIDIKSIDFVNAVKQFGFADGILAITVNAHFIGLGDIDAILYVDGNGNLAAEIGGLQLGKVEVDAQATVIANIRKVSVPSLEDYILNLAGVLGNTKFAVTADLLNMDISASVDIFGKTVLVRYADGKVYAAVGEAALVATIDKLPALISEIFAKLGIESADLPTLPDADLSIKSILESISLDFNSVMPSIGIVIDGLASVYVNFDREANFVNITADVMNYKIEVVKSNERVPQLDLNKVYIPVETLAAQLLEIYNNYKNVLTTGIAASIEANVNINGKNFALAANVNFNNGLHLNVTVADNANVIVAADVYFVNNVIYLDINGVRLATEINATGNKDNTDVNAILGLLAQAKGYNAVLDSVIDVIAEMPSKLKGTDYIDLLGALTHNGNVLSATVNGSMLGLSDFDITLAGTSNITLTVSNLAIGGVSITNLAVNASPECAEVVTPTADYVTELELSVLDMTINAKLDLFNKTVTATTTLLNRELAIFFTDGKVYLTYDGIKAMLHVNDIDRLINIVKMFTNVEMPEMSFDIDIKEIIDGIEFVSGEQGVSVALSVSGVNVQVNFDKNARMTTAAVVMDGFDVTAKLIQCATYPVFDLTANYVDVVDIAEDYANEIKSLMDANGYNVNVNGQFSFENHVYDVTANVVYNNGLYVNANVYYNANNMLSAELWYVNGVIYANVGDLKIAVNLANGNSKSQNESAFNLSNLKGYNDYLDGVLDVVQNVIDKFTENKIDYASLLGGLSFADGKLTVKADGTNIGLSQFVLQVALNNGLSVNVSNVVIDSLSADISASVNACNDVVVAPQGDFTTNLAIKIDDVNTVYANLDLLNGVYNLKIDDLYFKYGNGAIYVNKGDTYLRGDINKIVEMVKKIDDLVNDFSGAAESTAKIDFGMFDNIDVKAIVKSLTIATNGNGVAVGAQAFGTDINVIFAYGAISRITAPVFGKNVEITPSERQQYAEFTDNEQYIAIEQVFDDYFPAFEALVHTNSWKFSFDGDTTLSLGDAMYKVAAGSYLEFYYKNTEGMDTFKLRVRLDVYKYHSDTDVWQEFMLLDIVYKDGNIYVSDTGRKVGNNNRNTIKLTISVNTILKCGGLYDELVNIVPQIGELVDKMKDAMSEAEGNADKLSYANILTDASYINGVFGLALNGNALLSKLGEITLAAQSTGNGLMLNDLELHYDNMSVKVNNLVVTASEIAEVDGVSEYLTVLDINAYDTSNHMDFNSLYELLSSFIITATPVAGSDGARSFYIDGTASVTLSIGSWQLADIPIGLSVKVDITSENKVFVSAKIHRTEPDGALLNFANLLGIKVYEDKGGDSYLYYDGVNETFTVIRNSVIDWKHTVQEQQYKWHCTQCGNDTLANAKWCTKMDGWSTHGTKYLVQVPNGFKDKEVTEKNYYYERHFAAENLTTEQFTANIIDYIMEMFNFGSMIKDPIVKAINEPNSSDFGIEDILTDYKYIEAEHAYALAADLTAISDQLGTLQVNILHKDDYSLSNLNVDVNMLDGMCVASVPFELKPSTYGETMDIVNQIIFW